jgi:hypothetical protein
MIVIQGGWGAGEDETYEGENSDAPGRPGKIQALTSARAFVS